MVVRRLGCCDENVFGAGAGARARAHARVRLATPIKCPAVPPLKVSRQGARVHSSKIGGDKFADLVCAYGSL